MIKKNKHIEIVRTTIKGLSSMSQESCDSLYEVLSKHFTEVGVTIVNNVADLEELITSKPDLVFLGMEYIPNYPIVGLDELDKIWVSDALDDRGIAYTGSRRSAHELGRNKPLAKQQVMDTGLNTSSYCVIDKSQSHKLSSSDVFLDFPLFVKPTNRGGGLGIDSYSVVHNFDQLISKVHSIHTNLDSDALIEEYLPGREFSVALLKEEFSDEYLAMPIELVAPPDKYGNRLLSGHTKSANAEQALVVDDTVMKSRVNTLALDVFKALGARDYGRVDIRLDVSGTPQFLEVNLIPSLITDYGSFPKACVLNIGMNYESMITHIANLGLARNIDETEVIPVYEKTKKVFTPEELAFEQA